jgi:hypothetical protein
MADDESMALAKSMSTVRPGSRAASEMMDKVVSHAPLAVATRLNRDNIPTASIPFTPSKTASRVPTQMAPSAPPYIPSILDENDDAEMAKRQLIYDDLPCEEQRKQDDWASKKLANSTGNACPDNRKVSALYHLDCIRSNTNYPSGLVPKAATYAEATATA